VRLVRDTSVDHSRARAAQACLCSQMAVQLISLVNCPTTLTRNPRPCRRTIRNYQVPSTNPRHSREPWVPRPVVPWVEYDIVWGWQSVEKTLHELAMHCDHCPLVGRSGHVSKLGITYRMECGYSNRIGCPWQCLVFIYFDQEHAAALYHRKHANAPAVTTQPPDTTCYDRQTMFSLTRLATTDKLCTWEGHSRQDRWDMGPQ